MAKASGNNRYLRRGGGGAAGRPGGAGANPLAAAQEMLARAQADLAAASVEGTSGGGAVAVTMNGEKQITGIRIEPEVVDPEDVEMLQDLIMAAIADAAERAQALQAESYGAITGGLNIPGLSELGLG
ncbi:YbaB/EbfC family nucleoid-associated protein [bacterium]|jgi:DNA-binding YbaB/EbfC family protein|nr:YbaB/EbfC family nucleoid-associated protein [bacterium]